MKYRCLLVLSALSAAACGSSGPAPSAPVAALPPVAATPPPAAAPPASAPSTSARLLADDTPLTTRAGTRLIGPAGWRVSERGAAIILEAPEDGSKIAVIDATAPTAEAALAEAWAAYQPGAPRPLLSSTALADGDGWQDQRNHVYVTSPSERRSVSARVMRHGARWTVRIYDVAGAVAGKRSAQIAQILDELLPAGYARETFAGRTAHPLDAARVAEVGAFIERARDALAVPGVSIGLVQGGKVVFAGGFGVREFGKPAKVDADTRYLIASNTKSLTTLMLAKLVDEQKLTWETPVATLLPSFRLGDDATTRAILVKHLLCACTGLPRQDIVWLLERMTAARALAWVGQMTPTSKLGEIYQYSNPIAAAAGYVGGHVAFPALELGAAYDRAMQTRVFDPLGMTATTLDFARARRGNYARGHATDIDGATTFALPAASQAIVSVRPAGGAWSTVRDLLKYVQMELAGGLLPGGRRYISQAALAARTAPQIAAGPHLTYGMGLEVDTTAGTPVVHHGGRLFGYRSNMLWLPEHGVGAVLLINSDSGNAIMPAFTRKLLEVLFDGEPRADRDIAAAATALKQNIATARKRLTVPPDREAVARLAPRYISPALGELRVRTTGTTTIFDFGEIQAPVATRRNPDDSISFLSIAPGFGMELVVGPDTRDGARTLVIRDAQHEYVFTERAR